MQRFDRLDPGRPEHSRDPRAPHLAGAPIDPGPFSDPRLAGRSQFVAGAPGSAPLDARGTPPGRPEEPASPLDALVDEITELRPLSAAATRILELTESEQFSAHELANVIATDQALTAKMLQLANSAYYGFPRRIMTARDAVVLLGFRAVRSTTIASCVIDTVGEGSNLDADQFWRFSVSVGMLAELLARTAAANQDQAFTAGILHNIGLLALDQHRPDPLGEARQLAAMEGLSLHEAEQKLLGFSDAELGGALAERWNFPQPLVEAVRDHAMNLETPPDPKSLTAFVIRARIFARSYGITDGVDEVEPSEPPEEWTAPPLSVALEQNGGIEGVVKRADAFIEATVG